MTKNIDSRLELKFSNFFYNDDNHNVIQINLMVMGPNIYILVFTVH